MNVDVIFPGWVPFSSLAMASDLRGFLRGHDVALGYDFDTFVPGHLTRLGTRSDVETQQRYFNDLVDTAMQYLDDVLPPSTCSRDPTPGSGGAAADRRVKRSDR